jgi:hypothetical protein
MAFRQNFIEIPSRRRTMISTTTTATTAATTATPGEFHELNE